MVARQVMMPSFSCWFVCLFSLMAFGDNEKLGVVSVVVVSFLSDTIVVETIGDC